MGNTYREFQLEKKISSLTDCILKLQDEIQRKNQIINDLENELQEAFTDVDIKELKEEIQRLGEIIQEHTMPIAGR